MTTLPLFYHPKVMEKQRWLKFLNIFMVVLLAAILGVSFFFAFYKRGWTTSPEPRPVLKEALSQICSEPQTRLRYEGVHSYFQYLEQQPQSLCPLIKGLRERKDPDHSDGKNETSVRYRAEPVETKWPHFCLSKDSSHEPCLAFSFTSNAQNEVTEYVESLGCLHYVFSKKVSSIGGSSEVAMTSVSEEDSAHPYEASGHPRDIRTSGITRVRDFVEGENWLYQPIEDAVTSTGRSVRKVDLVSIDVRGQEWPILSHLVASHDHFDILQVSARIHLPDDIKTMSEVEMHTHFSELHQILEGLDCLGYKLIFSQPLVSEVMEVGGQRYPMAYQVSWLKEKSIL